MSVDAALNEVLELLSDGQATALAASCAGSVGPPSNLGAAVIGAEPAARAAVEDLCAAWSAMPSLTGEGVALALRLGMRSRAQTVASRTLPVWTGPGALGEQRLTAGVLHELISSARERITLLSYATVLLPEVSSDLNEAIGRGCTVDVVFENSVDSGGAYSGTSTAFADVPGIRRWRWPKEARSPGAVLHAKVLIVDGRRALVGSANLTRRALHANLEAGVLINDSALADTLERHVRHLMEQGFLIRE